MRRLHRREPLRPDVRVDAVLAEARRVPASRSPRHRGATPLPASDAALMELVDRLVADGRLVRDGRHVRLPEHQSGLDPTMRDRVDRLLAGLEEAGTAPPRVDGIAARLGIPAAVVDQLRAAGELVAVAPGIDYPRGMWGAIVERVDALAASGPLTVRRTRDGLRTSRRHAEAILARRRSQRQTRRRPPGKPGSTRSRSGPGHRDRGAVE